jgi:Holliday junction resolvasome RuvABC endonuclease subunit
MPRVKKLMSLSNHGRLIGIDQSARGTAAVVLEDGKMIDLMFYADNKTTAKKLAERGALMPVQVTAGDELSRILRLEDLKLKLRKFLMKWKPAHAALEDYALARLAYSHTLGEVGAIIKLELFRLSIPFRIYDVHAIKMFATGDGSAEKADMIVACCNQWEKLNFLEYGKDTGAGGNVADAYSIAQLLRTELLIRAGELDLKSIPDEKRRVFLRTTKQKPVNILDTPFCI